MISIGELIHSVFERDAWRACGTLCAISVSIDRRLMATNFQIKFHHLKRLIPLMKGSVYWAIHRFEMKFAAGDNDGFYLRREPGWKTLVVWWDVKDTSPTVYKEINSWLLLQGYQNSLATILAPTCCILSTQRSTVLVSNGLDNLGGVLL